MGHPKIILIPLFTRVSGGVPKKCGTQEIGYNWTFIGELKGWDGPIIDEYGISATPTIFVLDKDKKIIAKPLSKADIVSSLGN